MGRSQRVFKKRKNFWKSKNNQNLSLPSQPIEPKPISSSKIKIGNIDQSYSKFDSSDTVYDIVNLSELMNDVFLVACCKVCRGELTYNILKRFGLATKLSIICNHCDANKIHLTSPCLEIEKARPNVNEIVTPPVKQIFDINIRLVYAMRSIGKGQSAAALLCAILNLPSPPSKFARYNQILVQSLQKVASSTMKEAVEQAVNVNEGSRDLAVALDGTWQKRGHVSLNGVVTATSVDTGLVIDVEIMSKFCKCPSKSNKVHLPSCKANFQGVSGAMEVQGAMNIFSRSLDLHNARYITYLGDGDSKGFQCVTDNNIYGDVKVEKLECINHVGKRMGTRLQKLKQKMGKTKLSDDKTISGRGRLTNEAVIKIQKYYDLAIRRNVNGTVDAMKKAVWGEYFHISSSNETPMHTLCPKGSDSWCKYQRAVATKTKYDHNRHFHLPQPIMLEIKPIFQDLAQPSLLRKCLHGKNQNPNESVNNIIWSRLPKGTFVQLETLKLGTYDAISTFNKGNIIKCMVLEDLGMSIGKNSCEVLKAMDKVRIRHAEKEVTDIQKKVREARKTAKRKLEELYEEDEDPENPSYAPGQY